MVQICPKIASHVKSTLATKQIRTRGIFLMYSNESEYCAGTFCHLSNSWYIPSLFASESGSPPLPQSALTLRMPRMNVRPMATVCVLIVSVSCTLGILLFYVWCMLQKARVDENWWRYNRPPKYLLHSCCLYG